MDAPVKAAVISLIGAVAVAMIQGSIPHFLSPPPTPPIPPNTPPYFDKPLSPDLSSSQLLGSIIIWTTHAKDNENDRLSYNFKLRNKITGSVLIERGWMPSNSWTWNTQSTGAGEFIVEASVKDEKNLPISCSEPYTIITGQATRGELLYHEYFSGTYSSTDDPDYTIVYRNGRAHITVSTKAWMVSRTLGTDTYSNFILEVDATKEGGPDENGYGVIFRFQDWDNFYRFRISSDGYYSFDKQVAGKWRDIVQWTESSVINRGRASNLIKVEAQGSRFTFYVNGVRLGQYTDSSFASGEIKIEAGARSVGGVHISFDNLKVWEAL